MAGDWGSGVGQTGVRTTSGDVTAAAVPVRVSTFTIVGGAAGARAALHVFGGGGSSLYTLGAGTDGSATVPFPDGLHIASGLHIVITGTATASVAYDILGG